MGGLEVLKFGRKRPMTDIWDERKNKKYLIFEGIVGRMARKQKTYPCHFDQREKSFELEVGKWEFVV